MVLCLCFFLGCGAKREVRREKEKQCMCGNGRVEKVQGVCEEACDGTDLGGKKCEDFEDYTRGVLSCKDDCTFDFSQCSSKPLEVIGKLAGGLL
jgi:hypothetical protein